MTRTVKTLNILYDALAQVDEQNVSDEAIFYVDQKSGDMVKIAEYMPEDYSKLMYRIKKKFNRDVHYATINQKVVGELSQFLKPAEFRILMWMVGKMTYNNAVFNIAYRDIQSEVAVSMRTVTSTMTRLMDLNLIIRKGTKHKKVYTISPSICWKGGWGGMKRQVEVFKKNGAEQDDETEKEFSDD